MKDLHKIEKIIQEELSISQNVLNIASSIIEDIKNGLKQTKGTPLNDNKRIYYRKLKLKNVILDKNVYINVDHYNFHDSNVKTNSNIDVDTSLSSSGAINIIQITCYSISGKLVENKLLDSLFHEIEHIYQSIKGSIKLKIPDKLYNIAHNNLYVDDIFIKASAWIIYYSYNYEQDAFVNGLYGFIKNQGPLPQWENLKESDAYKSLLGIRKYREILFKIHDDSQIQRIFNLSVDKIIKMSKAAEKRLLNKIGKILIKHQNDMINEGTIFHFNPPGIRKFIF